MIKKMSFPTKVLAGLVLGAVFGLLFPRPASALQPIGDIFIRLLKLMIVPMVLLCVTTGIAQLGSTKRMGRTGLLIFLAALATNLFGAAAGALAGAWTALGTRPAASPIVGAAAQVMRKPMDLISLAIPDNLFSALASDNTLAVVLFSIMLGTAIVMAGEKAGPLAQVVRSGADVVAQIMKTIIWATPVAVFCLFSSSIVKNGPVMMGELARFVVLVWLGTIAFTLVWTYVLCAWVGKRSWLKFLRSVPDTVMMALATCSSAATLPLNIENTEKHMGVPRTEGSMLIGIGTAVISGGSSFYRALAACFLASVYGVHLTPQDLVLIVLISAFVPTAGIPSAGTLSIAFALNILGVPLDGIAMLMGVDRLRDMISTASNVVIHSAAAVGIHYRSEGGMEAAGTAAEAGARVPQRHINEGAAYEKSIHYRPVVDGPLLSGASGGPGPEERVRRRGGHGACPDTVSRHHAGQRERRSRW